MRQNVRPINGAFQRFQCCVKRGEMWTCAGVLALLACASAVTRDQFYPHGPGYLDQNLPRGSEVSSPEISLKVPIKFYGETYDTIFVSSFYDLSFGVAWSTDVMVAISI